MKKLFVQFYLLLFVCFLVMTMLVGLVYKFTAERAGRQSLDDLMKSSLYLMRSELREIPPRDWSKTLKELDLNLSFDLHIEPPTWVLGDMVLAQGHAGILFPSQANDGGTNVVVYVDRLKDGNSVVVNDPDGRLPRDQSSWKR